MPNKIGVCFDPFTPLASTQVAVAVSGGADSMALLHMAHEWAKKRNLTVTALTIDHQLRSRSAAEAKNVAAWCASRGIDHHALVWRGVKPKTDIQNKARVARRALLLGYCAEHGIGTLLMGHHADDQAETMLMRLMRGSGVTGLAAMRVVTTEKNIRIVRPLLSVTRADLRAYCKQQRVPFTDDPSNTDDRFERARLRKILSALPDLSVGATRVARRLARADDALDAMTQKWLAVHKQKNTVDFAAFRTLEEEVRLRVLAHMIPGGALDALERLDAALMTTTSFKGVTLGGVWVRPKVIKRKKNLVFQAAPARRTGKKT
jgi:tRNA(Ile)-lysidine synthase